METRANCRNIKFSISNSSKFRECTADCGNLYYSLTQPCLFLVFHVSFQEHNGENIEKGYMLQVYYIRMETEINSFDSSH